MKRRYLRIPREELAPLLDELMSADPSIVEIDDAMRVAAIRDFLRELLRLRVVTTKQRNEIDELRDHHKIAQYQRDAREANNNARTDRIKAAEAEEARRAAERDRDAAVSACDEAMRTMQTQVEEAEGARDRTLQALKAERAAKRETLRMFKNPAMVRRLKSERYRLRRLLAYTTEALATAVDEIRHLDDFNPEAVDAAERAVAKPLRRDSEAGQRARELDEHGLPVFEPLLDLYRGWSSSDTDLPCPPRQQPGNPKREKKRSKERRDIRELRDLRDLLANPLQGLSYAFDAFWILLNVHREAGQTRDIVEAVMRDIKEILVQDPAAARLQRSLNRIYGEDDDFDEQHILELYRRRSSLTGPLDDW